MNRKEEYALYMKSPQWKAKIKALAEKVGGKFCAMCLTLRSIDTHHITYARVFNERLEDLIFLCRKHHYERHEAKNLPTPPPRKKKHKHKKKHKRQDYPKKFNFPKRGKMHFRPLYTRKEEQDK